MLDFFFSKLKLLLKSPMVLFVYGILSKWYLMIMLTSVVVTFWVFKGLSDAGILESAERTVSDALKDTKSIARYCVPKILDFGSFWECLENPPSYEATKDELDLEQKANDLLDFSKYPQNNDPYAK